MKAYHFFLIILIVFFMTVPVAAFNNIVVDPSFETTQCEGVVPTGITCDLSWTDVVSHTGRKSLSISNFTGSGTVYWEKDVTVEAGENYFITAWVQTENLSQGNVNLACYTAAGTKLADGVSLYVSTNKSWQMVTLLVNIPAGENEISIRLQATDLDPEAKVYFDDLVVFMLPGNSYLLKDIGIRNYSYSDPDYVLTPNDYRLVDSGSYGGFLSFMPDAVAIWSKNYYSLGNISQFPAGSYNFRVRYKGSPKVSWLDWFLRFQEDPIIDAAIPRKTSDGYYFYDGTITISKDSNTVLSMTQTNDPVNPIDWIWFGSADMSPPPELEKLNTVAPPSNLKADTSVPMEITLSWAPSSDANVMYQVYRGTEPGFALEDGVPFGYTSECSFTGELDQLHDKYYFKVVAWNDLYIPSKPSNEIAVDSDNVPPEAPGNVTAVLETKGVIKVQWEASPPSSIDGDLPVAYEIYRKTSAQTPEEFVLLTTIDINDPEFTALTWYDRGVKNETYQYAIRAIDDAGLCGDYAFSNEIEAEEDDTLPCAPSDLKVYTDFYPGTTKAVELGSVYLEWSAPAPASDGDLASYYCIYRSSSYNSVLSPSSLIAIIDASQTHYHDVSCTGGQTFYYAVTALDKADNESAESTNIQAATPALVPVPKLLSPLDGRPVKNGNFNLQWEKAINPTESSVTYTLELSQDPNFIADTHVIPSIPGAGLGNQITYPLTELLQNGIWYWRVKACFSSGVNSPYSEAGKFIIVNQEQVNGLAFYAGLSPKFFSPRKHEKTTIILHSFEPIVVTVNVFNIQGQKVCTPYRGQSIDVGLHDNLIWDGKDQNGNIVANGLYYILIDATTDTDKFKQILKVQVVR